MSWYARPSWRLFGQVTADLFVLGWAAGWWLVGRLVDATIRALAAPARQTAQVAADLQRNVGEAANQAAGVPWVGPNLRQPFDSMAATLGDLVVSANGQVAGIEQTATLVGLVTFAIPVLMLVVLWLPARLRFVGRARAARALAAHPNGAELLALRALANRPLRELAPLAPDPMAAWRAGDAAVIGRLADLELAASGVRPRRRP
nr:hypothetical protein [Propionibacterium sp.]